MKKELLKMNVYVAPSSKAETLDLPCAVCEASFTEFQNEDLDPEESDLFN